MASVSSPVPVDTNHPVTYRISYFDYNSRKIPYLVFGDTKCELWFSSQNIKNTNTIDEPLKKFLKDVFILDYADKKNVKGIALMRQCGTTIDDDWSKYAHDEVTRLVQTQKYVYGPLSLDQLINYCDLTALGVYAA